MFAAGSRSYIGVSKLSGWLGCFRWICSRPGAAPTLVYRNCLVGWVLLAGYVRGREPLLHWCIEIVWLAGLFSLDMFAAGSRSYIGVSKLSGWLGSFSWICSRPGAAPTLVYRNCPVGWVLLAGYVRGREPRLHWCIEIVWLAGLFSLDMFAAGSRSYIGVSKLSGWLGSFSWICSRPGAAPTSH